MLARGQAGGAEEVLCPGGEWAGCGGSSEYGDLAREGGLGGGVSS